MPDSRTPINVFELHSLPVIAARIERVVSALEKAARMTVPKKRKPAAYATLAALMPLVADRPQHERITNLLKKYRS